MPRKIKVIIVDDEVRLRRGVERLVLSNHDDWQVIGSYSNGIECFEAVHEKDLAFDLLITDVKMPGMDGLTLIKKLKEFKTFHAMVISGFDDFHFLQTAIRQGASDYSIKPIDRDDFQAQLENVRQKIIAQWLDNQYIEKVQQTRLLSEMTWKQEVDLTMLEWTKEFPKGLYKLMYISMDNITSKSKSFQKKDWKVWTFAINNICEEMLKNLQPSCIRSWRWNGEDLSFWLLLHDLDIDGEESFEQTSYKFAEELQLNTRKFTPFTCSIAISQRINDLTLLPLLKDDLLTYIQFRLLYGGNQIFSKATIESFQGNKKKSSGKEIENQINKLIFSLDRKNQEQTKSEMAIFLNAIHSLDTPDEIEQYLNILAIQVIHYMIKHSYRIDELPMLKEIFGLTKKKTNITELKNEVKKWINTVLHYLEKKNESQNLDHISLAKKWIMDHLNQNLTIQKIASQVYMNPTYFCEYFKNQTGETVLDFVTRIRIEEASVLLKTTDLKIYDISEKVGYTDTKYFSKLFKKRFGETPSKYREKIMLDQI